MLLVVSHISLALPHVTEINKVDNLQRESGCCETQTQIKISSDQRTRSSNQQSRSRDQVTFEGSHNNG